MIVPWTLLEGHKPVPIEAREAGSWAEFFAELHEGVDIQAATKSALFAVGPYSLTAPYRKNENVGVVSCPTLDYDSLTQAGLMLLLGALRTRRAFVHASPSDSPALRKVRVYPAVSRALAPDEVKRFRRAFAASLAEGISPKELGPQRHGIDPACLHPSALFYIGRITDTPLERWEFNGAEADVDEVLSSAPKEAPTVATPGVLWADKPDPQDGFAATPEWLQGLADLILPTGAWDDGRQEWALSFFGWTAKTLSEDEQHELVDLLQGRDPDKYHSLVQRADPSKVKGPGESVKKALAGAFEAIDHYLATHPRAIRRNAWALRRQARAAAPHEPGEGPADEPPKIVARDGRYWLFSPELDGYCPPLKEKDLEIEVSAKRGMFGSDICVMKDGVPTHKLKPMREILQNHGEVAMHIALDFTQRGTTYDRGSRTLTQGFSLPVVEPVYDADVHAWLSAMFQEGLPDALDWVASCRQDRMQNLSACLAVVGAPDLGKSLLFLVLARLWGAERPVSLSDAVSQFNGPITECPIILDDECKALKAEIITSSDFRERIQMTSRYFEMKGIEKRTLRGAQRMGVTANDLADIRFPDMHGREAVAAIADRFSLHAVPPSQTPVVKAALQRLRPDAGSNFVELDRFMGHFAWIWATHVPRVQRFIGRRLDETIALRAALANSLDQAPEVFMQIETFLSSPPAQSATAQALNAALAVRAGKLYASPTGIGGAYADIRQVHRALKPFHVRSGTVYFGAGKTRKAVRMWELDVGLLRTVLTELDPAAVDARLAAE